LQNIRLRYAGFVAFFAQMLSVAAGILFTIMVTRRLSETAFGSWLLISNCASCFVFPAAVVGYWVTRYEARGTPAARTGLVMNSVFSFVAVLPYLVLSWLLSSDTATPYPYFLGMGFFVVFYYPLVVLESVAAATQPESQYQGWIVFEVSKVVSGFLLLLVWRLELTGVISALIVAFALRFVALGVLVRRRLGGSFNSTLGRRMVRHSWIPLYGGLASLIGTLDYVAVTFLASMGTATMGREAAIEFSKRVLGNYGAAYSVAVVVSYSASLAVAVYPRLLGGGGSRDVEESLRMVSAFAVPMCIGAIILARPILGLINPIYVPSYPAVFALAVAGLLSAISAPYDSVIMGTEKVELGGEPTFRDFVRSRLFLSPTIVCIGAGLRLLLLLVGFLSLRGIAQGDVLVAAVFWSLSYLFSWIPVAFGRWRLAGKALPTVFPRRFLLNILVACAVMSVVALLFSGMPVAVQSSAALATLLPVILASAGTYFVVLYMLDEWFRSIVVRALSFLSSVVERVP